MQIWDAVHLLVVTRSRTIVVILDHHLEGLRHRALGPSPLSDSIQLGGIQELASLTSFQALFVQGPLVEFDQSSG